MPNYEPIKSLPHPTGQKLDQLIAIVTRAINQRSDFSAAAVKCAYKELELQRLLEKAGYTYMADLDLWRYTGIIEPGQPWPRG